MMGTVPSVKEQSEDGNENGKNNAMKGTEDTEVIDHVNFLNVDLHQV